MLQIEMFGKLFF